MRDLCKTVFTVKSVFTVLVYDCVHRYELFYPVDRCFGKTMLMTNAEQ